MNFFDCSDRFVVFIFFIGPSEKVGIVTPFKMNIFSRVNCKYHDQRRDISYLFRARIPYRHPIILNKWKTIRISPKTIVYRFKGRFERASTAQSINAPFKFVLKNNLSHSLFFIHCANSSV